MVDNQSSDNQALPAVLEFHKYNRILTNFLCDPGRYFGQGVITIHQYPGLEELLFHDPGERAAQLPLLILQILHIQSEVHTCLNKLFLGCK